MTNERTDKAGKWLESTNRPDPIRFVGVEFKVSDTAGLLICYENDSVHLEIPYPFTAKLARWIMKTFGEIN